LSGLIVSRGISQVSEMILATVSKVEGISKSLIGHAFRDRRRRVCDCGSDRPGAAHLPRERSAARIAKRPHKFNAAKVSMLEGISHDSDRSRCSSPQGPARLEERSAVPPTVR